MFELDIPNRFDTWAGMGLLLRVKNAFQVATAWAQLVESMKPSLEFDFSSAGKLSPALQIIERHDLAEHAVAWFIDAGSAMVAQETAKK